MPTVWQELMTLVSDRVDVGTLPAIYAAVSVSTPQIREELRVAGLPWLDAEAGLEPQIAELDAAAALLVKQARTQATALGAASGVMGAAGVPPEMLGHVVSVLRLGQRLAVLYGFDPDTDAGRVVLWRAVAAAFGLELPSGRQESVRLRDLPDLIRAQLPAAREAGTWVGRQLATRTAASLARRVSRLVPGLSTGFAAWGARRRMLQVGEKMIRVYRGATVAMPFELGQELLAEEV